jgi:hypothetical protein
MIASRSIAMDRAWRTYCWSSGGRVCWKSMCSQTGPGVGLQLDAVDRLDLLDEVELRLRVEHVDLTAAQLLHLGVGVRQEAEDDPVEVRLLAEEVSLRTRVSCWPLSQESNMNGPEATGSSSFHTVFQSSPSRTWRGRMMPSPVENIVCQGA